MRLQLFKFLADDCGHLNETNAEICWLGYIQLVRLRCTVFASTSLVVMIYQVWQNKNKIGVFSNAIN